MLGQNDSTEQADDISRSQDGASEANCFIVMLDRGDVRRSGGNHMRSCENGQPNAAVHSCSNFTQLLNRMCLCIGPEECRKTSEQASPSSSRICPNIG
jgi:hypothetical protein